MQKQKQYLPALTEHKDSAMQIFQTNNDISTPEKLAAVIADESIARYKDIPAEQRKLWIGSQIYALCLILHYQAPTATDVEMDCAFADQMIMDDSGISSLKQVEMQEAFRRGIAKEYGEFYGITASTLVGFLKAYRKSGKRAEALSQLYAAEVAKRRKDDSLFWETLAKAQEHGFEIPSFQHSPFEDDEQHRARIARQREEILKQYGKEYKKDK